MSFAGRLRVAMKANDLNASQLAALLDTSPSRTKAWLDGDSLPGGEHMTKLPGVLHIDGHWLLTGDGNMVRQEMTIAEASLHQIFAVVDRARDLGLSTTISQAGATGAGRAEIQDDAIRAARAGRAVRESISGTPQKPQESSGPAPKSRKRRGSQG